jgi:hypothetical protein
MSGARQRHGEVALAVAGVALALRLLTLPGFVETADGWRFVRGVERYSVPELRPHWPGYPLYIGLGKLVAAAVGDRVLALHLVSAVSGALAAGLLALLAGEWAAAWLGRSSCRWSALTAGLLFTFLPVVWVTGNQIGSDSLGLSLALVSLLGAWRTLRGGSTAWLVVSGLSAAAMLGVRLADLALVTPFLYAAGVWTARAPRSRWRRLAVVAAAAGLCVVAGLAIPFLLEGDPAIEAARLRLGEHFAAWGHRVIGEGHWWRRPALLLRTLCVYGMGTWWPGTPWWRLPATLAFGVLTVVGLRRLPNAPVEVRGLLAAFGLPYLASILAGQDVGLDRYLRPLAAVVCLLAALGAGLETRWRPGLVIATCLLLGLATAPLAARARREPPLAHQVAEWMVAEADPGRVALVVTQDVAPIRLFMTELAPGFRCVSSSLAAAGDAARRIEAAGLDVILTAPPPDSPNDWDVLARFVRDPLLESRGPYQVWLFSRRRAGPP